MKQKIVGTYYIGFDQIQVVLREGTGGEFWHCPEEGSVARMKVGADQERWEDVLSCLFHEATEFTYDKLRCRFSRSNDLSKDHSEYMFMFNHNDLSHVCACLGEFTAACLPDLSVAYKKWNKLNRRKRK